jgi:hypothetical protein
VDPLRDLIAWCAKRPGLVIGDFGCGEAELARTLGGSNVVHSFDHVAIGESVTACDMTHVPLVDDTLDVAIFSLSLMGANFRDYLAEAWRTLKLDGQLHIVEPTARFDTAGFPDRSRFLADLGELGFAVVGQPEDLWKFTHVRALKAERRST